MGQRYTYGHRHSVDKAEWYIQDMGSKGYCNHNDPVVFTFPFLEAHWELDVPPDEVRAKFEELEGRPEFVNYDEPEVPNVVEMISDEDENAWDQPCAFGYRVDNHAVYCHNNKWLYAPRKCRRSWYTGGKIKDEDCRGFKPNPLRPK